MPRRYIIRGLLPSLLLLLVLMPLASKAQNQYVYLVKASSCTHSPFQRALTGFRVRGVKGIITALHGVADSRTISVTSIGGNTGGGLVTIYYVDVQHDLARLSSPSFEKLPADGLVPASAVIWKSLAQVKVIGYPLGLDLQDLTTPLTVGSPPLKILNTLLDAQTRLFLQSRRSPDPSQQVLYLVGFLHPGHSGAPILDESGRVVAVADGGLQVFSGIGWAIPWKERVWKSANREPLLTALREKGSLGLFSFDTDTATAEKRIAAIQQQLNSIQLNTTQLKRQVESEEPRRLTDDQASKLSQILQQGPKGQVYIEYEMGDTEAKIFAIQLENNLSNAGWPTVGVTGATVAGTVYIGLHIQVRNVMSTPRYAGILQQAFKSIGFTASVDELSGIPEGEVHLFVGAKP